MPFTQEQFLNIFSRYNLSVWPAQIFFYIAAFLSLFLLAKKFSLANSFINSFLTFLWLWMGIVYHIIFFSQINPAANVFGGLFILQGILFIYSGLIKKDLEYKISKSFATTTGFILIMFALFVYPFLGVLFYHIYPASPTFGLPCPTTIFTFGLLLLSAKKIPVYIIIIPVIWSLIGFTAAVKLGIYEDTGLLVSGIVSGYIIIFSINKKYKQE